MSTSMTRVRHESDTRSPVVSLTLAREHVVVATIVVGQALWLGFVMLPGWYSGADLPNIAYANGRSLGWDYLTSDLGGHFGAAPRVVYWLLNRAAPLEWWLTVVIRVAFQALATILLWRLFRALVGPRPWLWIVLVGYAFSAYSVPSLAALNSGLGFSVGLVCFLGAMLAHVRYARERRLVDAAVVAILVVLMLAFNQASLPLLAILPLVSVVFLQEGTWRDHVRGGLRLWPGWLMLAIALAAFAVLYLSGDYNSPSSEFTAQDGVWLSGQAWLTILGPALVGGPWQFYSFPHQWSAYADPPVVLLVLGQVALVVLILLSLRRTGKVALAAWLIPVWTVIASLLLVGVGRSWLGEVLPTILRYSAFVPVTLALGVVLAFGASPAAAPAGARASAGWLTMRRRRVIAGGAAVVLLTSSIVSTASFADRFWENPAEEYTTTLLRDVEERGPTVQLFDTLLPEAVVPFLSQMHVSDLVTLAGASADFTGQSSNRLIVTDSGRLAPANFVEVADLLGPRVKGCGVFVRGKGTSRIRLTNVSRVQEWFLQLELYQPRDNRVTIRVLDEDGEELPITSGSNTLDMRGELAVLHRRLAAGIPETIVLESSDRATNFCLVHAYVGVPLP